MEHLSLELSKRLHELGVVVEADFHCAIHEGKNLHPSIPTPTFEELWAMLPDYIFEQYGMSQGHYDLELKKSSKTASTDEGERRRRTLL